MEYMTDDEQACNAAENSTAQSINLLVDASTVIPRDLPSLQEIPRDARNEVEEEATNLEHYRQFQCPQPLATSPSQSTGEVLIITVTKLHFT